MGFLAPALLALGAAVSIPLILHLFQRHQGPRVIFPALRYLRRAEKEHARRIRLRQLLLMLLRVATLALLALAAARPFLRAAGAGHEPTAVAIVLDNSMSTGVVSGDRRVLDILKDRALETLAHAGPEDRFWLIRAGEPWAPALAGDAETTATRVRDTEPSAAAARLADAVMRARSVLETGAGALASEIHLLTDLQASNLPVLELNEPARTNVPLLLWYPADDPPSNLSVTDVRVGGGIPPTENQRSIVAARLAGSAGTDSVAVRLTIDDRVVAVGYGAPGDVVLLPFPPRRAGLVGGWVETDADPLRADDRRAFALSVRPAPGVASSASLTLASHALAALENAGRVRRVSAADADVLILPAAQGLETVPPGRSAVILAPDSLYELPAANRRLAAAAIPWRYEPAELTGEGRFDVGALADELTRTLAQVRILYALALEPLSESTDSVLLRLADGRAWAIRGQRRGGGTWILLASPFSEEATTLPTSAAMVPLLDRIITEWTVAGAPVATLEPGSEIALPDRITAVVRPDGEREQVTAGTRFRFGAEAGVYRLATADSILSAFAVNPSPEESDLSRLSERRLSSALPGWDPIVSNRPQDWGERIFRGRLGREVWQPFLVAAFLLLFVEALVAATGPARGKRAREDSTAAARVSGSARVSGVTGN
ncbi:MAG: BatA domain-containing protein [Longimicrobiales bacterium]